MVVGVTGQGGGTLLGGQALEISVCMFQLFSGWEGFGVWVGGGGSGWVWGLGIWQPASHSRKLASFTRTKKAVLDAAWICERSTPVINHKNRNSEMRSARVVPHIDCYLLTQLRSRFTFPYFMLAK